MDNIRTKKSLTPEIRFMALKLGTDLIGIADLRLLKGIFVYPDSLLDKYEYAISMAVNLNQYGSYDNRTEEKAFDLLERVASRLRNFVEAKGYKIKVIPPDKRVGKKEPFNMMGAISHKAVAKAAGLGWIGKSMLLVTPRFGPRICLATLLTNAPLIPDKPITNKCGECLKCIKACPVNALKTVTVKFYDHPEHLEEILDLKKCAQWIDKTWCKGKICYSCMLICPRGVRKANKQKTRGANKIKI